MQGGRACARAALLREKIHPHPIVRYNFGMETRDKNGYTPLIRAAADGDTQAVRFLLETGAEVDARDNLGRTALVHAVKGSHLRIVELLVDFDADVHARDDAEGTPMKYATRMKNEEMLRVLQGEYDEDERDPQRLTEAQVRRRRRARLIFQIVGILVLLIAWRSVLYMLNMRSNLALMEAVSNNDTAGIATMLNNGVRPDSTDPQGVTPLMLAASDGRTEITNLLLKFRAHPNLKDASGEPVLMRAGLTHPDIVEALLRFGATPNSADAKGKTLLAYACETENNGQMIHLLLDHGATPNVKTENGMALACAIEGAYSEDEEVVKEMLEKGASPNSPDGAQAPILLWCADKGLNNLVKLLLAKGADIRATDSMQRTALHLAAQGEHSAVVQQLLAKGADVDAQDKDGETAVMYAIFGLVDKDAGLRAPCAEILHALIAHGANLSLKDHLQRNAIQYALGKQQFEMASLLRQSGAHD